MSATGYDQLAERRFDFIPCGGSRLPFHTPRSASTVGDLGAKIKALETKNLIQLLAEPNVLAQNGKEASFLAGGQAGSV